MNYLMRRVRINMALRRVAIIRCVLKDVCAYGKSKEMTKEEGAMLKILYMYAAEMRTVKTY